MSASESGYLSLKITVEMYVCQGCQKAFTASGFGSHLKRKTPCKVPTYYCTCGKGFLCRRSMIKHHQKCSGQKKTVERIRILRDRLNYYLSRLPGNFVSKLDLLEQLLNDWDQENFKRNEQILESIKVSKL